VPIAYLGLWDAQRTPGVPTLGGVPLGHVHAGRHALAIDGGLRAERPAPGDGVAEAWFRGGHPDVAGGYGGCRPLADIALDWVLDGALDAGLLPARSPLARPAPTEVDALAGSARIVSVRRVPTDAPIHASVEVFLRAHPQYWRRLPERVHWADDGWLARGERLVPAPASSAPARELASVAS
jgi:hypothetical protein